MAGRPGRGAGPSRSRPDRCARREPLRGHSKRRCSAAACRSRPERPSCDRARGMTSRRERIALGSGEFGAARDVGRRPGESVGETLGQGQPPRPGETSTRRYDEGTPRDRDSADEPAEEGREVGDRHSVGPRGVRSGGDRVGPSDGSEVFAVIGRPSEFATRTARDGYGARFARDHDLIRCRLVIGVVRRRVNRRRASGHDRHQARPPPCRGRATA